MAVAESTKRNGTLSYDFGGSDARRICIHSSSGPASNAGCRPGSAYRRQRPGGQSGRDSLCTVCGRKSERQPKHGEYVFEKHCFTFDKRLEPADAHLGANRNAENYRKRGFRHCGLHAQQQIIPGRVFLRDNVSDSTVSTNEYD
jgi:hypothetical protein